MSNRQSTGGSGERNKRWSLPSLQPLEEGTKQDRPAPRQHTLNQNKANRGSISGTSYGKSDFGVQLQPGGSGSSDRRQSNSDRRQSRRISRISKLSDVSEVESERTRSRHMSNLDDDMPGNRRMSRRISVADHLVEQDQRRMSRKMSMMSTANSILNGTKVSMMNRTLEWQQNPETLQKEVPWSENLQKPSNWIQQKKKLNTAVASALVFCYTVTISVYAPAPAAQVGKLSSSSILTIIPYSAYALGFAFGPAIATPLETAYGRKIVFFAQLPFFALLMIGSSVSKSIIALAVTRFLSALCLSPGLWLSIYIMSEVWIGTCETILPAVYVTCLVLGFAAGPVVGDVVVQYESWRWSGYIPLFLVIVLLFTTVAMSESQEDAIKRKDKTSDELAVEAHERRKLRREQGKQPSRLVIRGNMMFKRPIMLLLGAPALSMASLYLAYTLAMLMTLPMLTAPAFGTVYKFSHQNRGITFTAVAGGMLVALGLIALADRYIHQPRVSQWELDLEAENEKQLAVVGRGGNSHASWRKGLAVTTRNLGLRNSTHSMDSTMRSNSNASSHRSEQSERSEPGSINSMGSNGREMTAREKRKSRLQAFSERNINIAIAVTRFLNSQPENADRKIIVERVMVLLKNTESFTTISNSLAQLGLTFEEALLAKVIADSLSKEKGSSDIGLARSRSLHRLAAQAALMGGSDDPVSEPPPPASEPPTGPLPPSPADVPSGPEFPMGPPPEWRWLPSLLASVLFPAGLLMIAWTMRKPLPWIVPVVGLAVVGLSSCMIAYSAMAYMWELYWDQVESANARAGSFMMTFVLGAALPLVARPMVNALGFDIGLTIFAAVAALLGVVPWIIAFKGESLRPLDASRTPSDDQGRGPVEVIQEKSG
ncbi:MFS general substrate transporter [Myriangium duriaei CBS 260.36]|uniref:MFS general substrate transporter n=1 Tax=Myriangium duriaei CBS 260.36 TaxID=1168546 RepID=A0A9P4MGR5_9PEZI|nr:MFS general substrate transporter [Myriangium duriaei CBS 260.36]